MPGRESTPVMRNLVVKMSSPSASRTAPSRALAGVAVVLLVGMAACGKNDMFDQVRVDPGERPASPAPGSIPTEGWEPPALTDEEVENLHNPIQATAASVDRGRVLFGHHCAPCHGAEGKGDGVLLEELGELDDLARSAGPDTSDGYLYTIIREGSLSMPSYGTDMDPPERWDLVNFLRTLAEQ